MKKSAKVIIMALLSASMLLGTVQTGLAQQLNEDNAEIRTAEVESEIEYAVTDKFSEYYMIDDALLTLCGVHTAKDGLNITTRCNYQRRSAIQR